ncbi:MAG: hypothetical protein KatS3mg031_2298 [Chitinophagales bacterium]|nr:MAG: hypothetical protein KatS3mg031_2298 [Chitinophagales bacterium]
MGKKKQARGGAPAGAPPRALPADPHLHRSIIKVQALVLFLFSLLLYANTLWNTYAVDDAIVITKNTLTTQGIRGIPKIMTTDAFYGFFGEGYKLVEGGRYRPLSIVTFALEYALWGLNPHLSHFINILLFALTVVVLYFLLIALLQSRFQGSPWQWNIPFLAAVLFAAHPIHTEAVANIKGRDEIMGLLFALLTLYCAILYVRRARVVFLCLSLLHFILALLSKENAITYLAVVPLAFYFFTRADIKKYLLTGLPMLALAVVYVVLRQKFTGLQLGQSSPEILNNPFVYSTTAERYATISYTLGEYIRLLLFPHPLTHDYYFNQVPVRSPWSKDFITWSSWKALLPLIVNGAIIAYALIRLPKKDIVSFAILYYYITLSIVSNIVFTVGIAMNERFLYMPSVGFCLLLAVLLVRLTHRIQSGIASHQEILHPKLLSLLTGIILLGYSVKTFTRNFDWKDDFTLFKKDVQHSPNSAKVHNALGGEYLTQSEKPGLDPKTKQEYIRQAEKVLARALEIYPDYLNALLLMGNAKYKLHDSLPEARYYYERTLKMKPNYFEGNFNMGCILLEKNYNKEAIPYFQKAIREKPEKFEPYYNLAEAYFKAEMPDSAIEAFKKVITLVPDQKRKALAYYKIGLSYGKMKNDLGNAIKYLSEATRLDSTNVVFFEDLGVAYGLKQDYPNAIRAFERTVQLDPKNPKGYANLGITYRQMQQEEKAQEYFRKAKELNPALNF